MKKPVHYLLEILKKRLKPHEQTQIKETDSECYDCALKSVMNTKGNVTRCLTIYWNKNIYAIVQCTRSSIQCFIQLFNSGRANSVVGRARQNVF